jgi:hypothetical protein
VRVYLFCNTTMEDCPSLTVVHQVDHFPTLGHLSTAFQQKACTPLWPYRTAPC